MNKSDRDVDCVLITVFVFFLLVALDILVVESIYRPSKSWDAIWLWSIAFWTMVVALPIAAAKLMQTHLPLYIPLLVAFGLEDTAFYLLQLQLPTYYVGVSILGIWEPHRDTVLILNLLAILLVMAIESFYRSSHFPKQRGVEGLHMSPSPKTNTET